MSRPDTLKNALVRRKNGTGLRRVIRDDGLNGLHVANPNEVANTKFITREEFDTDWELVKSGEQQSTEDISGTIFKKSETQNRLNKEEFTNHFTTEVSPMAEEPRLNEAFEARIEPTDREAMKEEILNMPAVDSQSDGQPVAGNEDPISTMEPDRMDPEADENAPTGDPEAQADEAEMTAPEDSNAFGDEPIAANEDPTTSADAPKKRGRKAKA